MKKSIIALLVIMLVASVSLFAVVATTTTTTTESLKSDLTLQTDIAGINYMKLTASSFAPETPTVKAFEDATANEEVEKFSSAEEVKDLAYLSILTNKRTGFSIYITATQLENESQDYKIDYKVTCDDTYFYASKPMTGIAISETEGITSLSAFTYPISIDLDDDQYAAALEDEYTGTVTFTYKTN
jgi:uncharacterized protein YxeA